MSTLPAFEITTTFKHVIFARTPEEALAYNKQWHSLGAGVDVIEQLITTGESDVKQSVEPSKRCACKQGVFCTCT